MTCHVMALQAKREREEKFTRAGVFCNWRWHFLNYVSSSQFYIESFSLQIRYLVTLQSTLLIRSLQCTCSSTEYVHMHVTLILSFSLVECRLSYIIKFCGGGYTPYVKQAESIFQ